MERYASTATVAALVLYIAPLQAAITVEQPTGTVLDETTDFRFQGDDGTFCDAGNVTIFAEDGSIYYDSGLLQPRNTGDRSHQIRHRVDGLVQTGQNVTVQYQCTINEIAQAPYTIGQAAVQDQQPATTTGVVTLAPNATVALSPDAAVQITSGLTQEQFSQVALSIMLTLATAIGVRQVLKVLT